MMKTIFNFFKLIFSLHKITWWVLKKSEQKQIEPLQVIEENKEIGLDVALIQHKGLIVPSQRIYGLDLTKKKIGVGVYSKIKSICTFKGLDFSIKPALKIVCTDQTTTKPIPKKFKISLIPDRYMGLAFRMGTQNYVISADDSLTPKRSGHLASGFMGARCGGRILE